MAATPVKLVRSAAGTSVSGNGPSVTASRKKASRQNLSDHQVAERRQVAGGQRRADDPRQGDDEDELGQDQQLAATPWAPNASVAAKVTKFPVTWAANKPCRPRKPAVSTNPPLKVSSAPTSGFRITMQPRYDDEPSTSGLGLGIGAAIPSVPSACADAAIERPGGMPSPRVLSSGDEVRHRENALARSGGLDPAGGVRRSSISSNAPITAQPRIRKPSM